MITARTGDVLLICRSGGQYGKAVRVTGKLDIGRHPKNEMALADPDVSRRHASVILMEDGLFVTDHASSNGTFVNGRRVNEPVPVSEGDLIRVGGSEFVVRLL